MKQLFIFIRRIIYLTLFLLDVLLQRKSKIVVLCYHSVAKDSWRFSVDPEMVKKHVRILKKHYTFISLDDLNQYLSGVKHVRTPSVVLTFDDGYKDILSVRKFLNAEGIKPAVFVLSNNKQANMRELQTKRKLLNREEIHMLQKDGWIVGCHSATHADFSKLTQESLYREVTHAKKLLEQELGGIISYFAYPKGRYTKQVITALRQARYRLALTMDDAIVSTKTNYFTVPRVGVDRTHTNLEFRAIYSPSVILFRRLIKSKFKGLL